MTRFSGPSDWTQFPPWRPKHAPCPGCDELADECVCPHGDPLAAFTITTHRCLCCDTYWTDTGQPIPADPALVVNGGPAACSDCRRAYYQHEGGAS